MEACKFDCEKTCDLCDSCTPDSTQAECSTLCKLGKDKCSEYCTNGQEKCLKYLLTSIVKSQIFFKKVHNKVPKNPKTNVVIIITIIKLN